MRSLLLAGPLLALAAPPADACSPPPCWPGGFVPRDGATIPANAPGFYFRPSQDGSGTTGDASLVRLRAAGSPTTSLGFTAVPQPGGDFVIVPDAPLVPGETYTLEDGTTCAGSVLRSTFTAAPDAPLPVSLGTVTIRGPAGIATFDVPTTSGSCSTAVEASVTAIALAESTSAAPWTDLLLYETLVDDRPWIAQTTINVRNAPGESWVGRGMDLVYHVCTFNAEVTSEGVARGDHQVRFRASLPGMAQTMASLATPAAAITLSCGDIVDVVDERDGGCASGRPSTFAIALALLALVHRMKR